MYDRGAIRRRGAAGGKAMLGSIRTEEERERNVHSQERARGEGVKNDVRGEREASVGDFRVARCEINDDESALP